MRTSSISLKEPVSVYTIVGQLVKQVIVLEGRTLIPMAPGVYVVEGQKCLVR